MSSSVTYTPNIPANTSAGLAAELRKIAEVIRRLRETVLVLEERVAALEP